MSTTPEPEPLTGACVWTGADLAASPRWRRRLEPVHLEEIAAATAGALRRGVRLCTLRPQNLAGQMIRPICDEQAMEMRLEPGDMQFLNNHVVYHSRTPFEDAPQAEAKRLLYRLWLSVPNSRALPEGHEVLWGDVRAGALRGGIGSAV